MRCLTGSAIPSTEGCKRPITVIAPPGTLVNARSPAAVYQRMIVCHTIVDLVMGAMAQAVPERVMGDSCGCLYNFTLRHRHPFGQTQHVRRSGARRHRCDCHRRRHGGDGLPRDKLPYSAGQAVEMESPVLYLRREMRCDSGGHGQFRGGVGGAGLPGARRGCQAAPHLAKIRLFAQGCVRRAARRRRSLGSSTKGRC